MILNLSSPFSRPFVYAMIGMLTGTLFAAIYLVAHIVGGGVDRPDGTVLSPFVAIPIYVLGGITAGVIFAALHRFLKSQWTALMVGILAMAPYVFGIAYYYFGSFSDASDLAGVMIIALGIGASTGFAANEEYIRDLADQGEARHPI